MFELNNQKENVREISEVSRKNVSCFYIENSENRALLVSVFNAIVELLRLISNKLKKSGGLAGIL